MGGNGSGTLSAAIIKLNGVLINKEGKEEKTNFFDFLDIPLDDYSDIEMTPEQAIKFRNTAIRMKIGVSAAIPLICVGNGKCPNQLRCPLRDGKLPIGKVCPLESSLVDLWTKSYLQDLAVDPSSISQMSLVNRLVELDLLDFRANTGLSGQVDKQAPTLLKTDIEDTEHGVKETTNLHPLLEAKSKFNAERLKILEALVATNREQYKKAQALGKSDSNDAAQHMSEMAKIINDMKTATKQITGKSVYAKMLEEAESLEKENEKNNVTLADWEELGD